MSEHKPGGERSGITAKPAVRQEDDALVRVYQKAASGDAWHERRGGGPWRGGDDPALAATPELPDVPRKDVARPDRADGEDRDAAPLGPRHDAPLRRLEPGETGMSPAEVEDATDAALERGLTPGEMMGEDERKDGGKDA